MLYSQKVRTNTNTKQQEASEVRGTIEVETVHRALPRREPNPSMGLRFGIHASKG